VVSRTKTTAEERASPWAESTPYDRRTSAPCCVRLLTRARRTASTATRFAETIASASRYFTWRNSCTSSIPRHSAFLLACSMSSIPLPNVTRPLGSWSAAMPAR
jgi:hypothetical protein